MADEKTNNITQQEITESIEKKNITENVTETVSTSTTENESEENHVNKKPQKKENIFIQLAVVINVAGETIRNSRCGKRHEIIPPRFLQITISRIFHFQPLGKFFTVCV